MQEEGLKIDETQEDEFGFVEPNKNTSSKEVPIKLETRGEIVSSVFESRVTKDLSEKKAIETMQYGDLRPEQRGSRRFEEILWTTQKKALDRCVIAAPVVPPYKGDASENKKDYLMCGTNGTFCFALQCKESIAQGYLEALQTLEEHSFDQELGHRFIHMKTQGDAKEFMNLLNILRKREPTFEKLIRSYLEKTEKKLQSKTEPLEEGKETYSKQAYATERVFPVVTTLNHTLLEYNKERLTSNPDGGALVFDEFVVYYCNTSKLAKSPGWTRSKIIIRTTLDTVPCLAFNETHLAVLHQPHDEVDPSVVTISLYRLNDHPAQNPCDQFYFQFPKEHFTEQGLLNMTMNNEGIITVAFANGVVAVDSKRVLPPRIFLAGTHIVMSSAAHKQEFVILGTNQGECIGVDWKTGDIVFTEITPVIEPIYSVHYSNKRTFMHTACAISGRMSPYQTDGMTHLPTGRLTGMDVCGTLIFAAEKYGNIEVFSSAVRAVVFPFKAPKELFQHKPKDPNSKEPPEKQEYQVVACPPYYPSIKATPDRLVTLYQNGLVVVYYISNEGHRWIEAQLKQQQELSTSTENGRKKKENKKEKKANSKTNTKTNIPKTQKKKK